MGATNDAPELLPGTLDLLILRTLQRGSMHGYGIAQHLRVTSEDVLQVGESSLYPALQRLLVNGWITGEWGLSDNNRRARFYSLTPAGRKRLAIERKGFDQMVLAIQRVLETSEEGRRLDVANFNSFDQTVIAGPVEAIAAVKPAPQG